MGNHDSSNDANGQNIPRENRETSVVTDDIINNVLNKYQNIEELLADENVIRTAAANKPELWNIIDALVNKKKLEFFQAYATQLLASIEQAQDLAQIKAIRAEFKKSLFGQEWDGSNTYDKIMDPVFEAIGHREKSLEAK